MKAPRFISIFERAHLATSPPAKKARIGVLVCQSSRLGVCTQLSDSLIIVEASLWSPAFDRGMVSA
ncbi:MAG: hypothetical protein JWL59_3418 [Chthoniobacteraceae bacterium]|nr:hypothetical protein [Chthoniobacteraceae bacterium]